MNWLHDLDTLRSLSDETGPIAHWARLQRLARGASSLPPLDEATLAPGLALDPSLADAVLTGHPAELGWVVHHAVRRLGLAPSETDWTAPLTHHLATPHGAAAASTLTALGHLTRDHVITVLGHDRDDTFLPAWVLSTTTEADLVDTSTGIAADLREDLAQGCPRLLQCLPLLTPGHPETFPQDPVEAAQHGAELAGTPLAVAVPKGSHRTQGYGLLRTLGERIEGPLGGLIRALGALDKAPPIHAGVISAASWAAHFESSGDPLTDVLERGSRRPVDLQAARTSIERAPDEVSDTLSAMLCLPFLDDPEVARRLLSSEELEVGVFWMREAAAAKHPDAILPMLSDPERRADGFTLAGYCPTEEMLAALLQMSVPADPEARAYFAEALLRMGVPVVLPTVRALIPHLDPAQVPELAALSFALYNDEL